MSRDVLYVYMYIVKYFKIIELIHLIPEKLLYKPTLNLMFVLEHTFFNAQSMTLIQMICFITLLIRRSHLDIVKFLVNEAHCKADTVDQLGKTPLHYAAE